MWGFRRGKRPAVIAIHDDAEALKGLLLLGEKTDAKKVLASVKDAVFEGI
jgi:hypothetical protein